MDLLITENENGLCSACIINMFSLELTCLIHPIIRPITHQTYPITRPITRPTSLTPIQTHKIKTQAANL